MSTEVEGWAQDGACVDRDSARPRNSSAGRGHPSGRSAGASEPGGQEVLPGAPTHRAARREVRAGPVGAGGPTRLADSVGLALLMVLDTLTPAERLAFVLHDLFAVPFDEIAPMVDRAPAAARQLLGPDVVLRSDFGGRRRGAAVETRGAAAVAGQAFLGALPHATLHPAVVNGAAGVVITVRGRPFAVMGFTVVADRITAIFALADPERVGRIAAAVLSGGS